MIKAEGLVKIFRNFDVETTALNNVTLNIEEGEFVAVMGPSGCGKTTLLNILGLLDTPTQGKLHFLGQNITKYSERQRSNLRKGNLGFVFQSFNLIDELTVYENIELPLFYMKKSLKKRRHTVNEVLEKMKIAHRANLFPQQLSGGQQQRVAVARAVVGKPRLILADEPTGNLDRRNSEQVHELLMELNRELNMALVVVTHNMALSSYMSRRLTLVNGRLVDVKD